MRETETQRLVLEDTAGERGRTLRVVALTSDGELVITGQDLGKAVEEFFGDREYEFKRTLPPSSVEMIRGLLGLNPGQDLLEAIKARFSTTAEIEAFVAANKVPNTFWNRSGD